MDSKAQPPAVPASTIEQGLSPEESLLLTTPLPHELSPEEMQKTWEQYQCVIAQFLSRIGKENKLVDSIARVALVTSLDGFYARVALLPMFGNSVRHVLEKHGLSELAYRLAGECSLMELSAAAGYRTFCFPELVKGLLKTGKMRDNPIDRMMDTFEFLTTMMQRPFNDPRVILQLARTNELHAKYKVSGAASKEARDLFKYIALNMFYIGPMMRPDLSPQERHAICGLTVLVAKRMGHTIAGSVRDLEAFIADYEATRMFDRTDPSVLRKRAVEIAQASKQALPKIPTISSARIHGYVPYKVKKILEIE